MPRIAAVIRSAVAPRYFEWQATWKITYVKLRRF
jgi:hypothetical protein